MFRALRRYATAAVESPRLKSNPLAASLHVEESELGYSGPVPQITMSDMLINRTKRALDIKPRNFGWEPMTLARLRDNCRCASCVDPSTRQKTHTTGSVMDAQASKMFGGFASTGEEALYVSWQDGHQSTYTSDQLAEMVLSPRKTLDTYHPRKLWDRDTLLASDLRMPYSETRTAKGMLAALAQVQRYGVVIIQDVPTDLTDDATCELRAFAQSIGQIRDTFYGQTWDVKTVKNSKNVAYTSVNLGLHMDLLYFSSPPRFQLLHCLRNRVVGGSSYIADSFFAARKMQLDYPDHAQLLERQRLTFEYNNDGHSLNHTHVILPKSPFNFHKTAVNWSPPFQAPTRLLGLPGAHRKERLRRETQFYEAMHIYESLIEKESVQYEYTMQEGDLMLFDNRRVLHARRAFRDMTQDERRETGISVRDGEPSRWLKGCYIDGEAVWDKLLGLSRTFETVGAKR